MKPYQTKENKNDENCVNLIAIWCSIWIEKWCFSLFFYINHFRKVFFFWFGLHVFWVAFVIIMVLPKLIIIEYSIFFLFDHYIWSARHCSTWWSSMNDQNQLKKELFNSDIFLSRKSMFFFSLLFLLFNRYWIYPPIYVRFEFFSPMHMFLNLHLLV